MGKKLYSKNLYILRFIGFLWLLQNSNFCVFQSYLHVSFNKETFSSPSCPQKGSWSCNCEVHCSKEHFCCHFFQYQDTEPETISFEGLSWNKNIFLVNECSCYLPRIFDEPRDVLREEMEDNPAVDPADEVPRPESGLTGGGVLPHTDHTDPEARLLSPGRHPGHDGSPLLQVPAPRAGEAPGWVLLAPV